MKKIRVRFECDPSLPDVEVLIRASEEDASVAALMEKLSGETPDTLTVFDGYGNVRTLPEREVILAAVDGKLVNILTADGSWYTRRSLQSLEEALDGRRFVRVSRYELVNLEKVTRYDFTVAGTLRLELAGGRETWASRRCIPAIRQRLKGKG